MKSPTGINVISFEEARRRLPQHGSRKPDTAAPVAEDSPCWSPSTGTLAAEVLLQCDGRPRDVIVDEILREFCLGGSDAARCVKLAAAKLAYQELHPETTQGRACKPKKKSGKPAKSASFPSFEKHAEKIIGGWKERTISRWCRIGFGLAQVAYERLLGTALATDLGALETLSTLQEVHQVDVADLFAQRLDQEGRDLLARLATGPPDDQPSPGDAIGSPIDWSDILRVGPSGDAPPPASPVVDNPLPEHATELELVKASDGKDSYCILHSHLLAVADLGDRIRLTIWARRAPPIRQPSSVESPGSTRSGARPRPSTARDATWRRSRKSCGYRRPRGCPRITR